METTCLCSSSLPIMILNYKYVSPNAFVAKTFNIFFKILICTIAILQFYITFEGSYQSVSSILSLYLHYSNISIFLQCKECYVVWIPHNCGYRECLSYLYRSLVLIWQDTWHWSWSSKHRICSKYNEEYPSQSQS